MATTQFLGMISNYLFWPSLLLPGWTVTPDRVARWSTKPSVPSPPGTPRLDQGRPPTAEAHRPRQGPAATKQLMPTQSRPWHQGIRGASQGRTPKEGVSMC